MESNSELFAEHGLTKQVDCGALRLHIFDEAEAEVIANDSTTIVLSEQEFFPDELSSLQKSYFELLPKHNLIHAAVVFDLPPEWEKDSQATTPNQLFIRFIAYLRLQPTYANFHFSLESGQIVINEHTDPMQRYRPPMTLSGEMAQESSSYIELRQPATAPLGSSHYYDQLVQTSELWGHLHNFIVQAEPDETRSQYQLAVGNLQAATIGQAELQIIQAYGEFYSDFPSVPMVGIEGRLKDIDLDTIARLNNISEALSRSAMYSLFHERMHESRGDVPATITAGDIADALLRAAVHKK